MSSHLLRGVCLLGWSVVAWAATPLVPGIRASGLNSQASRISYSIQLRKGQCLTATVDQGVADLSVTIRGAAKSAETRIDVVVDGEERIWFIPPDDGLYTLTLGCQQHCVGRYGLAVHRVAEATGEDRRREQTLALSTTAKQPRATMADVRRTLAVWQSVATVWEQLGETRLHAAALAAAGESLYLLGNPAEAQTVFETALRTKPEPPPAVKADLLISLGLCRWRQGDPAGALQRLQEGLAIWRSLSHRHVGEASTLSNLGIVSCQSGECHASISYYVQALKILAPFQSPGLEARALHNLALAYMALGDNRQAAYYLREALPRLRAANDKEGLGRALNNYGFVLQEQGKAAEAITQEREALRILIEGGIERPQADARSNLGLALQAVGERDEAQTHLEQALQTYRKIKDRRGEGSALYNLALVALGRGDLDTAIDRLKESYEARKLISFPDRMAATLCKLAGVETQKGQVNDASAHVREALDWVESLRGTIATEPMRTSYFAARQSCYETAVDIQMRLHEERPGQGFDAQALSIADSALSRSLLDAMGARRGEIRAGIDPGLLDRESTLRRRVNDLSHQLNLVEGRLDNVDRAKKLLNDLDSAQREYQLVDAQIQQQSPAYAAFDLPKHVTLSSLQSALDNTTLLLEFSLGPTCGYGWAVTAGGVQSFKLPPQSQVEQDAAELLQAAASGRTGNAAASRLSQALLTTPALQNPEITRLVIVGDGRLLTIPFGMLPAPGEAARRLIDRYEIVQLPSSAMLSLLRTNRQASGWTQKLAVFADPVFNANDPRTVQNGTRGAAGPNLARLPFSAQEARSIAALIPPSQRMMALGTRASKKNLLDSQLASYEFVHFATHAIVDPNRPELSGLALSQVDRSGKPVDGWLRLADIYNLRLPARLVVLSACRTGLGKQVKGEGNVGLTRAFFFAGARSVVVSLWPIDDEATAELMRQMYARLLAQPDMPASAALREAQLAISRKPRWRRPYYWAGFQFQGDWQSAAGVSAPAAGRTTPDR